MEVAKLAAPPNLEVRIVSCNGSAIKRWLSSELEETVFSLTHELFMSKQCIMFRWMEGWRWRDDGDGGREEGREGGGSPAKDVKGPA